MGLFGFGKKKEEEKKEVLKVQSSSKQHVFGSEESTYIIKKIIISKTKVKGKIEESVVQDISNVNSSKLVGSKIEIDQMPFEVVEVDDLGQQLKLKVK